MGSAACVDSNHDASDRKERSLAQGAKGSREWGGICLGFWGFRTHSLWTLRKILEFSGSDLGSIVRGGDDIFFENEAMNALKQCAGHEATRKHIEPLHLSEARAKTKSHANVCQDCHDYGSSRLGSMLPCHKSCAFPSRPVGKHALRQFSKRSTHSSQR